MIGKHRIHPRRLLPIALLALALALPASASATILNLSAGLEANGFSEFSQTNALTGTLSTTTVNPFRGSVSARATYDGGGANGYSRGIWDVHWQDGEDVWFGAAYYLPIGFHASIQGQVDLMRWDNYSINPSNTDWGGVSIYGSDHRARLLRFGAGRPNDTLVGPLDLPEGRWFTLEVHQRRSQSSGSALSELYVDGKRVGSSTAANTYGRAATRVRYGIVAIAASAQKKPLELNFDSATTGVSSALSTVTPPPSPTPTPEPTPAPEPEPAPEPIPVPAPEPEPTPVPEPEPTPTPEPEPAPAPETAPTHGKKQRGRVKTGSYGARSSSLTRHTRRCGIHRRARAVASSGHERRSLVLASRRAPGRFACSP
jgi:hypothetical protein